MSAERGFKGIDAVRKLQPNWDSYNAPAISPTAIKTAMSLLLVTPLVVPRSNGGIQLEWHQDGLDWEIVINPDGTVEAEGATTPAKSSVTPEPQLSHPQHEGG